MRKINNQTWARLEELQGSAQELADLLREIHDLADDYFDTRTERWHETDRADAYGLWRDAIDGAADSAQEAADSAGQITQSPEE